MQRGRKGITMTNSHECLWYTADEQPDCEHGDQIVGIVLHGPISPREVIVLTMTEDGFDGDCRFEELQAWTYVSALADAALGFR